MPRCDPAGLEEGGEEDGAVDAVHVVEVEFDLFGWMLGAAGEVDWFMSTRATRQYWHLIRCFRCSSDEKREKEVRLTGSVDHFSRLELQFLGIDSPLRRISDHLIRSAGEDPIADLVAVVPMSGAAKFRIRPDLVKDFNEGLGGPAGALCRLFGLQQVWPDPGIMHYCPAYGQIKSQVLQRRSVFEQTYCARASATMAG